MMTSITRWILAHKRIVTVFWIVVTVVGIGAGALQPIEVLAPAADAPRLSATLNGVRGVHGAFGVSESQWQRDGTAIYGSFPEMIALIAVYEVFILARMREEHDASGSTDARSSGVSVGPVALSRAPH
jgi:hypothetical protein